ncbi:MAG: O-antigen ligase family protein [Planctomycetales bacterium]
MTPAPARRTPTGKIGGANSAAAAAQAGSVQKGDGSWLTRGLEAMLVLGASALMVARLFIPPEAAGLGDSLPCALLWFVLLGVWGWWRVRTADGPLRITMQDVALGLICGGEVLSAVLVWCTVGDQRTAINLLWEWLSLAGAYIVLSTLAERVALRNVLTRAILCGLIVSAGYGIWQHHVWYRSMAGQYLPLRQELDQLEQIKPVTPEIQFRIVHTRRQIANMGVDPAWISGPGRGIFENRLLQSREALGRCSLANTFAGLLLMACIPLLGLVIQNLLSQNRSAGGRRAWGVAIGVLLLLGVTAYALLLTKSRTAYLALLVGGGVVTLATLREGVPSFKKLLFWLGAGAAVVCVLIGVAWMTGGIDAEVLLEAPKSLQYRAEYWWSSWLVVRDHFLFGVGPGNFRPFYLQYKLPQSSEEIADPHNALLDVWTSGGLIAFAGLVLLIGLVLRAVVSLCVQRPESPNQELPLLASEPFTWSFEESVVLTGGMFGLGMLFLSTGGFDMELGVLSFGWLLLMILPWPVPRALDLRVVVPCLLLGVGLHLLGAGGVGMPGFLQVVLWFVVLLNVAPMKTFAGEKGGALTPRFAGLLGLSCGVAGLMGCVWTAYLPVAMVRLDLEQAEVARDPSQKLALLRQACAADPWGTEAWDRLAGFYFERWSVSRSEEDFEQLAAALKEILHRNPSPPGNSRQLGEIYTRKGELTAAQPDVSRGAWQEAALYYSRAVARYPYRADLLADWGWAASQAGDGATAKEAARRALAQEEINRRLGHTDKYLSEKDLERMRGLAGG